MSSDIRCGRVLIVGAGVMGREYARVLQHLSIPFTLVSRGEKSAQTTSESLGMEVHSGGLDLFLRTHSSQIFDSAIVAVGIAELSGVCSTLLDAGIPSILLEKPGGATVREIQLLADRSEKLGAMVYLAYNRRYYASVRKARETIDQDGGVTSFHFEFTEWPSVVAPLPLSKLVKENWFLANSTHVVDLAFYLGGKPRTLSSYHAGTLHWHPVAARFVGAGITELGALFSYCANWEAPGRWGVEIMTRAHRLILRPLEKLQSSSHGSVAVVPVDIEDDDDLRFKPGLLSEVNDFLNQAENLPTIQDQVANIALYSQICPLA